MPLLARFAKPLGVLIGVLIGVLPSVLPDESVPKLFAANVSSDILSIIVPKLSFVELMPLCFMYVLTSL